MTLEEAIEHAKEVARTCDDGVCASEHAQLVEWLSLLKIYTDTNMADEVRRARHEMHGWQLEWKREMERSKELEAENSKLREVVSDGEETAHLILDESRALEAKNAKLREKIKALTELASIGKLTASQCTELAEDNAKLRELAADMHRGICIAYLRGRPLDPYQYESRMRELGVEVG